MAVLISSAICVRCFGLLRVPMFFVQLTSLSLSLFLSFPVCSPLSSFFCFLLLLPLLLSYALPSSVSLFLTFSSPSVFFLFSIASSPSASVFFTLSYLCFFSFCLVAFFLFSLSVPFFPPVFFSSPLSLSPFSVQYILWLL